jgi:hypothetical protein
MTNVKAVPSVVYLYSSNQARLYEQDILDVMAAPRGGLRQFRYFERYLSSELKSHPAAFIDKPALIHFSLQQEEQYHPAVVMPVRWATIRDIAVNGDVYTLQMRMDDWCSLKAPRSGTNVDFASRESHRLKRESVEAYQKWLEDSHVPKPYDASAGVGADPRSSGLLEGGGIDALLFNYCCQFLQSTRSFSTARFYRIQRVRALTDPPSSDVSVEAGDDGVFVLTGGKTYVIELYHFQPTLPQQPERLKVSADGKTVLTIGKADVEIASRYDVAAIEIHAVQPSTTEAQETAVIVEPDSNMFGARIQLRLRVLQAAARTVKAVAGAAVAAILLGVPSLLTSLPTSIKVMSIAAATVLTGILASSGLRR